MSVFPPALRRRLCLLFAFSVALLAVGQSPALSEEPLGPAGAAANVADAPAAIDEAEEQYISATVAEVSAVTSPLAAPGQDRAEREAELRRQLQNQPAAAGYLELLELLGRRLAESRPGDEQLELEREVGLLWVDALERHPSDPLLLLANGDRLRRRGSLQAAWESYLRGEQLSPGDHRWTARLGALSQQAGDYPAAIARYRESLALRHDAGVVTALAEAHALNGDPAAALAVWNSELTAYPGDPALRMAYGRALFRQASYREALAQFQRGAQLDPGSDLFYNRMALCHFQLGEIDAALGAVRQALQLNRRASYYHNLAVGHEELGEYKDAEEWYRAGLAQFPGDPDLSRSYADFLDSRGRRGEALAQLGSAQPGSTAGALDAAKLAGLAEEAGDLDAAGQAWQAVLTADPTSAVALTAACAFYARTGDIDQCVEQVRVARNRIEPEQFADLLRETGAAFLAARDYAGGVEAFERILADHSSVPMVYNQLGLLQHMAGDSAAGLATVKRGLQDVNRTTLGSYLEVFLTAKLRGADAALALGPGLVADPEADYGAFELYAGLLLDGGRYDEAEAVAAAGLAKHPRRGQLLQLRTRGLIGQQKLEEAAALLSSGEHARLEFGGKARMLGGIYMDLSNYPRAVAAYTEALRGLAPDASPREQARALAELAEAQLFAGEQQAARSSATDALALDPQQAAAQVWLGWSLLALADVSGAVQAFEEARPASGDIELLAWRALGQARSAAAAGQRANAFSFWQQASRFAESVAEPRLNAAVGDAKNELRF